MNAALLPYVWIDPDALIEHDALLQVATPILEDPGPVVATGGIVRIANGCTIDHGRVTSVGLPRSHLHGSRSLSTSGPSWSAGSAGLASTLFIISGAFGLFQRSMLEEVGGCWTATDGEDVEMVERITAGYVSARRLIGSLLHRTRVCWTEAPEDFRTLGRQRRRWHRELGQTRSRHRSLIGNPRYGSLGLLALPYFLVFEFLGPVIKLGGVAVVLAAFFLGHLSVPFMVAFLIVALLLGICLLVAALVLEEFSFRRHPLAGDLTLLVLYAIAENLGYRQLNDAWRARGLLDLARHKKGWGSQKRHGIGISKPPAKRQRACTTIRGCTFASASESAAPGEEGDSTV
ncbi:MAG: glycosyltransferase family 2 protein [Acidimicrobiales bacterium]